MKPSALIDVPALAALLDSPRLVLLDCRFDLAAPDAGFRAYLDGHIRGARYAHLEHHLSGAVTPMSGRHPLPPPDRLAAWLASIGIADGVRVVAYDAHGAAFAARAWWLLRWLGHEEVAVLDGGLAAWRAAGGALQTGEPGPPAQAAAGGARAATPRPAAAAVVDAAAVLQALGDARRRLIDARAPERFAGEVEPIDPVAGHIPGAVNHPFQSNLAPDGRFLPPAELARRWRERLAGRRAEDAIMMCGSGVTACQNLLALEVAGLPGAKLYAGSFSEWIRDPNRPVARGR